MRVKLENLQIINNVRDLDKIYVAQLVEAGQENALSWPAIKVRQPTDAQLYLVIDGAHRVAAADELGLEDIEVELVEVDTRLEEIQLGIAANITHGKPFTREEKIYLAKRLHDEFGQSTREIAKLFYCHHSTVADYINSVGFTTAKAPSLTEEEIQTNLTNNFIKSCLKITEQFDNFSDFNSLLDDLVGDDGAKYNAVEQVIKSLAQWVEN